MLEKLIASAIVAAVLAATLAVLVLFAAAIFAPHAAHAANSTLSARLGVTSALGVAHAAPDTVAA